MSSEEKAPLVPKLRFPEFRNDKPWDEDLMNSVYCFKGNNSLSRDKLNYERGTIKNIHYGDIHTKFATHFDITREAAPYINEEDSPGTPKAGDLCLEGDVIFADASEDVDDIGKAIEIIRLDGEQVVSGLHTILARQTRASLVVGFGGHLFKSKRVRSQIQKESQGAKILGLAASRLAKIKLPFPRSTDEQQKIADCLSSLDGLIVAQARKVHTLKTHKKGLMQRLFLRDGQTQPQLRFPEFRTTGDWEERKAASLFTNRIAKGEQGLPIYSVTMNNGMVRRDSLERRVDDIEDAEGNKRAFENDIVYNMMRMWQGAVGVAPEDCLVSPAYVVLAPKKDAVPQFFQYAFKLPEMLLLLTSHSRGLTKDRLRLYFDDFARMTFRCPPKQEQQRIADFLISLDKRIAIQSEELESLQAHKKGLMQQLFPSAEALNA